MQNLNIRNGLKVLSRGRLVVIAGSVDLDKVQVQDLETGKFEVVSINTISAIPPAQKSRLPTTEEIGEKEMQLALHRYKVLSALLAEPCRTRDDAIAAAKRLNLSVAYVYLLLRKLDASDDNPKSLVRSINGRRPGSKLLSAQMENLIECAINEHYLTSPGCTAEGVYRTVKDTSENLGLKPPSRNAVLARINHVKEIDVLKARGRTKEIYDNYVPKPGKFHVTKPLESVQIDHCLVDIIIVDEKNRRPLCRPWLTIAIDVFTRVVLGYYLSLSYPSGLAVAKCISHAVLPKDDWLIQIESDANYPIFGVVETIRMDNAKEFRALALKMGCSWNNIQVSWRPVKRPHFGGHVERLIGTLMGKVHVLPGTTNSSIDKNKEYDSLKQASLTFREFQQWFAREVADVYHNTPHSGLHGETPLGVWKKAFQINGKLFMPPIPKNKMAFYLDFLPMVKRKVHPNGIVVKDIRYWTPELSSMIGKSNVTIKFDAGKRQEVYLRQDDGRYLTVPYADLSDPDVTQEEWILSKKLVASERGNTESNKQRFSAILKNRGLVDDAISKTKRHRRIREQQSVFARHHSNSIEAENVGAKNVELDYSLPAKPHNADTMED